MPLDTLKRRYFPLVSLALLYLLISGLLRVTLWTAFGPAADVPLAHLPRILGAGLVNDAVEALYLLAPLSLYLLAVPSRPYRSRFNRWILATGIWITLFGMIYLTAVEFFFFDEFDARFNLVAVDYLMYPHEVLVNIWDSYPVPQALLLTALLASLIQYLLWPRLRNGLGDDTPLRGRVLVGAAHGAAIAAAVAGFSTQTLAGSENRVENELTANGLSSLFQAFHTNELDFDRYYRVGDPEAMYGLLREDLTRNGGRFTHPEDGRLARRVDPRPGGLGRLNVVVVVEESLGCEHVHACGAESQITPELDALADQGLFFTHAYATGTRTVRGLEAITASIPPIPSESIVKRPGFEAVADWGGILREQGYRTSFIYGGYGQFDNMNDYFAAHGYRVSDRAEIQDPRFGNIWGVSDQDLFHHALGLFDEGHASGAPFFALIMTTSNHKPFSFPDGVPGVPPEGGGREAGVRYADHALGEFFRAAAARPWYRDTLFVVVADHGARVYGKGRIPLYSYRIPLLILAPGRLAPARIDTPASQVDIAPTVLGLMGLGYEAPFVGRDLLAETDRPATLLFNHNHDVALYRDGHMAVLGLRRSADVYAYALGDREPSAHTQDPELVELATAYYQTTFNLFRDRRFQ